MSVTKEYEIPYTLNAGLDVTIRFEAEYIVVDNGIGHYEYWGARGYDRQLDTECDNVYGIEILTEDGEPVTVSPAENKAIKQAAYDYASENCPEVSECVDDGDYDEDPPDPRDY